MAGLGPHTSHPGPLWFKLPTVQVERETEPYVPASTHSPRNLSLFCRTDAFTQFSNNRFMFPGLNWKLHLETRQERQRSSSSWDFSLGILQWEKGRGRKWSWTERAAGRAGGSGVEDSNGLRKQKGQNRIRTGWNFTSETLTVNENELKSCQSPVRYQNRNGFFTLSLIRTHTLLQSSKNLRSSVQTRLLDEDTHCGSGFLH